MAEPLRGVDSWAGIEPHPAVVNPAARPADDQDALSLRGDWDFVCNRFHSWRHAIGTGSLPDGTNPRWSDTNAVRRIRVPGCWEAQGVGTNGMSRPWVCVWDCSPIPLRHAFQGEGWYRKIVTIPSSWKGRRVWLKTGCIGSVGWMWVNGSPFFVCGCGWHDIYPVEGTVPVGKSARLVLPGRQAETLASGRHDLIY